MIYTITETIVRVLESKDTNQLLKESKKHGIVIIHKCKIEYSDNREIELLTEYKNTHKC